MIKQQTCFFKMDMRRYGEIKFPLVLLMVVLMSEHLLGDSEKDFTFRYVRDFAKVADHPRLTSQKQSALAKIRIGTYGTDLHDEAKEFTIPTGVPKRLFVSVSTDNLAMLFFEDSSGNRVSRHDFLEGKVSDECFYWGHPMHGVAARYGILRDTMLLLISPHQRQIALVLKRQKVDCTEIKKLPGIKCQAERDCCTGDMYSLVCETESDAAKVRIRARAADGASAPTGKAVAFYARSEICGNVNCRENEWLRAPREFLVLRDDGGFQRIVEGADEILRVQPYLSFAWWNEFDGTAPCGTGRFYAVRRNIISVIGTAFEVARNFDQMVIVPSFYRRNPEMIQRLETCVDELLRTPERLFRKAEYIRIADEAENIELRTRLDNALLD